MSATRARNLTAIAAPQEAGAESGRTSQIVSFRLADELYGIDIMCVQKIIRIGPITKLPEVPDFVRGLMDFNGHVIPVIDLRMRLGVPTPASNEQARVIVATLGTKKIGLIVDSVDEVLRIGEGQFEPAPSGIAGIDHVYVSGLVKLEEKLLILLNIENVLSSEGKNRFNMLTA